MSLGPGTIAYVGTGDGDYALYLVDVSTGTPKRLTKNPDQGHEQGGTRFQDAPAWSPDGAQIAFDSNRTGTYKLYLVDASSGREHDLGVEVPTRRSLRTASGSSSTGRAAGSRPSVSTARASGS